MNQELEVKLWPVGDGNTYIEPKNPYFLLKDFPTNEVPIKVISYRDETLETLEKVENSVAKKLESLHPSKVRKFLGDAGQLIFTSTPGGAILGISYSAFEKSHNLAGTVGLLSTAAIISVSGLIYRRRESEFNEKTNHVAENISKLIKTPVKTIKTEKDEELTDIFDAIENNKPLKMLKPKDEDSYDSIYNMLHGKFGSILHCGERLPTRAREVYKQKIDAYDGRIVRV